MRTGELRIMMHEIIDSCHDEIIRAVYTSLKSARVENILRESIKKYNEALDEAESAIDEGKFTTDESLKNETKKWHMGFCIWYN